LESLEDGERGNAGFSAGRTARVSR
jgi:hypothetical protein